MFLLILATAALAAYLFFSDRLPQQLKNKPASTAITAGALVLIWITFFAQGQQIGKLNKLADQVRYSHLVSEGKKLYAKKKLDEVAGISKQLIAADQGYGYFLRGIAELDKNSLDQAEADIQKALKLGMPKDEIPYAWLNLGNAAVRKKNHALARERFLEALKLEPDFQPARINLDAIEAWEGKKVVDKYVWGQQ